LIQNTTQIEMCGAFHLEIWDLVYLLVQLIKKVINL